ncbi:MAG: J domain-containing protein [Symploca sp. SIO2G7]|nr:J domain-containing protein [Symploca sp. SIO2G7]
MLKTEKYYKILEIEPEASPEEIHQGYLDLIWVWHPDRFVGHPRLQKKAHCKLQEINEAHAQLRSLRQPTRKRKDSFTRSRPQPSSSTTRQFRKSHLYRSEAKPNGMKDYRKNMHRSVKSVGYKFPQLDDWLD